MPDFGPSWRGEWMLDPSITYLNHGTVGAPPRRVLQAQADLRDEIERQPARFLLRELADHHGSGLAATPGKERTRMRRAADEVGAFLGVGGDDLAFVENATSGANAVLRSFPFRAGDEIVVTDLGYGGVTNIATYVARTVGATVRTVSLPRPGAPTDAFVDAVVAGLGDATRVLIIDHITAETALLLPLRAIADACHERGVLVLADGAHAPGAIELDIPALGVDWYTANLHKWAWTARSAGILWAAPEQRQNLHAHVISWGLDQGLGAEFDLLGTRDPTPYLTAPVAIAMMREIGVEAIRAYNHDMALWAGRHLAERWGTVFATPEDMIGTMATVNLPEAAGSTSEDAAALKDALLWEDAIEIPVFSIDGRLASRVSAQIYNGRDDVERLATAVLARC